MTPKQKVVAAVVGVILVYLAVDFLVVTDKERLQRTISDLKKAVEEGDADRCISFLSPGYSFEGKTRDDLLELGKSLFKMTGPMKIRELETKLNITGALAVYDSQMAATMEKPNEEMLYAAGTVLSEWRLSFRKEGDKWLIHQVELRSLNKQEVRGLDVLMR